MSTSYATGTVLLGKYEVVRVLGEGGMGVVLAARHVELDELVALKFLLPGLAGNPQLCLRFAREARTATRIKNDHVARVFDVGTMPDGAPFMVMEYLRGEDLAATLAKRGPLPVSEAVDLLLQACEAICEAHQLGVVHRDLKPANLFVTTGSDGMPFVKVLDFGISKSTTSVEANVTSSSAVLGSPMYMSPEQLVSSRDVDARSDVWSLGVILFELLAGLPPFDRTSFPLLCANIFGGPIPPLRSYRTDAPPELEAAIRSALERDRNARLPGVEAFAATIAPFGSDRARLSYERIARIASRGDRGTLLSNTPAATPSRPALSAVEPNVTAPAYSRSGLGLSAQNWSRRRWPMIVTLAAVGGIATLLSFRPTRPAGTLASSGSMTVSSPPPSSSPSPSTPATPLPVSLPVPSDSPSPSTSPSTSPSSAVSAAASAHLVPAHPALPTQRTDASAPLRPPPATTLFDSQK